MDAPNKGFVARVRIVGRKALVLNPEESDRLFKQFYGKPLSVSKPKVDQKYGEPLVLSLYEVLHLCRKSLVEVDIGGRIVDCETLNKYCEKTSHNFSIKYRVYEYLRDRNYVIKSGIKYGADFAVYTLGPGYEHAPYVVVVASKDHKLRPADFVALGRVSHSVRKHTVLAVVDEDKGDIRYIIFKWVKL
jgi:tRNA-intron endonuclease